MHNSSCSGTHSLVILIDLSYLNINFYVKMRVFVEFGNQQNQTSQPQPTIINNTIQQHPPNPQIPPPQIPTQTLPPIATQVPVTTTPILQAPPPQFAPPFTPAPPFLQPGVPPASFIPPQPAPILNYVQGQPQFPQTPYQGFQQPFNAVVNNTFYLFGGWEG